MAGVTRPATGIRLVPATRSVSGVPNRIAAVVRIEGRGLDAIPGRRWGILGTAVLGGLVFGGLRPGIERFYPESAPLLVMALAFGLFGRTPAAALVGGYVVADAIRYFAGPDRVQLSMLFGRIAAWILLWVLAGMVPRFARRTADSIVGAVSRSGAPARSVARSVVGGLVFAVAVFSFMQLMAYLIGPAYQWRNPSYRDVAVLQEGSLLIAAIVAVFYMAVEAAVRPRIGGNGDLVEIMPTFRTWSIAGIVARIVGFGVLLFLFQGIISGPLDVIMLSGAFIAGEAAAFIIGRQPRFVAALAAIPELIRGSVGPVVMVAAGYLLYGYGVSRQFATEYFLWVVAIAIGFFVMRVLFATTDRARAIGPADSAGRAARVPPVAAWFAIFATGGLLLIGAPTPLIADNCTGFSDCIHGALNWALAGLAAFGAFIWGCMKAVALGGDYGPPIIGDFEPLASADGAEAEDAAFGALKSKTALIANSNGQDDRADSIRSMSNGEFYQAAMRGEFHDLGIGPSR